MLAVWALARPAGLVRSEPAANAPPDVVAPGPRDTAPVPSRLAATTAAHGRSAEPPRAAVNGGADVLLAAAAAARHQGDLRATLSLLETAVARAPTVETHGALGALYLELGAAGAAEAQLRVAARGRSRQRGSLDRARQRPRSEARSAGRRRRARARAIGRARPPGHARSCRPADAPAFPASSLITARRSLHAIPSGLDHRRRPRVGLRGRTAGKRAVPARRRLHRVPRQGPERVVLPHSRAGELGRRHLPGEPRPRAGSRSRSGRTTRVGVPRRRRARPIAIARASGPACATRSRPSGSSEIVLPKGKAVGSHDVQPDELGGVPEPLRPEGHDQVPREEGTWHGRSGSSSRASPEAAPSRWTPPCGFVQAR